MKSSRRLPLTVVGALFVVGSGGGLVLLLRHVQSNPSVVSAVTVKEPVLVTSLEPSASVERTNPPTLATAEAPSRDTRCSTPMHLMQEALNLSGDQAEELEPILAAQQKQSAAFRRETSLSRSQCMARLKEMRETNDAQFKYVLTPEQFEEWHKRGLHLAGPSATDQQSAVTGGCHGGLLWQC